MRVRAIAALVFVVGLAVVLTIPLRDDSDEPTTKPRAAGSPADQTEEPQGDGKRPDGKEVPRYQFVNDYPEDCLQPVDPPSDLGLVAYARDDGVGTATVEGGDQTLIPDEEAPFKWSPSGRYLITASSSVYDANGDEVGALFDDEKAHPWTWSTIADCAVFVKSQTLYVFTPGERPTRLFEAPAISLAFSPGGGDFAFLTDDNKKGKLSVWIASLATGEVDRKGVVPHPPGESSLIAGWTPDASHILLWMGSREELDRKGVSVRAVSAQGDVDLLPHVVAHRDFLAHCGDDLLAVTGTGARSEPSEKRLAVLKPEGPPRFLTPQGFHDESVACSEEGDPVATTRSNDPTGESPGQLTILDQSGATVLSLPLQQGYSDVYPMWGRDDAGILFVRQRDADGAGEVWHLAPGDPSPSFTEIVLSELDADPETTREGWGRWIDWSADVPTGHSVESGG